MQAFDYGIVAVGTILWCVPFLLVRRKRQGSLTLDRRARWGVALKGIGYSLLWQVSFWTRSPALWQTVLSVLLLTAACVLSWTATFALGRQLRVDAALAADHALIRSGPYRLVRHPIYTSMLALFLGTGVLIATWYLLMAGLALFLAGAAIRIRAEDALLESRFGNEFRDYKNTVPSFIPLVR
jgi:protein-S-isoprenylcysteine O-methyltransferase Ste14